MKIGFIGAGKVGFSLGKYFVDGGLTVTGYYSQNQNSAKEAAEFTNTHCYSDLSRIVEDSDTLFLTVPDGAVRSLWDHIKLMPVANKNVCHCSGLHSSNIFSDIEKACAFGYSIHPLLAVSSKKESYKELKEACFTIEGSSARMGDILALFSRLGNKAAVISPEKKQLYHMASVTVSNHVAALAYLGIQLYGQCGLEQEFAESAWKKLFLGNAASVAARGPVQALTGPVERGDVETVKGHLACMKGVSLSAEIGEDQLKDLYCLLSDILLEIAGEKNPQRDYKELKRILEEKNEKHCCNISGTKAEQRQDHHVDSL